jgi:hypothetical protein
MVSRRDRFVLLTFAVVAAAWMVADALTGSHSGLLYLAPALLLALPLMLGRYVGEKQLVELAGRALARPRRKPARVVRPRGRAHVMQRGGRLVASGLATRPPPGLALPRIAR